MPSRAPPLVVPLYVPSTTGWAATQLSLAGCARAVAAVPSRIAALPSTARRETLDASDTRVNLMQNMRARWKYGSPGRVRDANRVSRASDDAGEPHHNSPAT